MSLNFCPFCGSRIPQGAPICPNCHNNLTSLENNSPQQMNNPTSYGVYQNTNGSYPMPPKNGRNGKGWIKFLLISAILALFLVCIFLTILVMQRCSGNEKPAAIGGDSTITISKAEGDSAKTDTSEAKRDTVVKEVVVYKEKESRKHRSEETYDEMPARASQPSSPLLSGTISAYDGFLNIRSRPNARSRIVDVYYNGNTIYYRSTGRTWVKVYDYTGTRLIGYANSSYID